MDCVAEHTVLGICNRFGNDPGRLIDIVRGVQACCGLTSPEAIDIISKAVGCSRVSIEEVVSFYAFLSDEKKGGIVIRLCDDIVDQFKGFHSVEQAFEEEFGFEFGQRSADGRFSLEHTPCIGMSDQAPAALVNDVVITKLTGERARQIVRQLKQGMQPAQLITEFGDGHNSDPLVQAMVVNNIREAGPVLFSAMEAGAALRAALAISPVEVIRAVKVARLRGRGGAGFPTGMKWEFTRAASDPQKIVICNADEGEPGTFKDRVLLTERADLLFEGMAIAGYAIGAKEGLLYLRAEYSYLQQYLESVLERRRQQNLLGKNICGKEGFDFDVRIQMGAGAYICGEETALISSCEGLRGDPKNRPPFPAQKGYQGRPTAVNNVETLCCVARILEKGAGWFAGFGNEKSTGTKLLSISGDCRKPGVYEIPFGISLRDVLERVDASNPIAVQVGGPSGVLVAPQDFDRVICFEDLATGGSIIVFGEGRDLLQVVEYFTSFFNEESCGYCTPCRVGNQLLLKMIKRIRAGQGEVADLEYLSNLGAVMKSASRCGLGQTSANPVLSSLKNFRELYTALIAEKPDGMCTAFNLQTAVADAEELVQRKSVHL